jgi:hypothetical protein
LRRTERIALIVIATAACLLRAIALVHYRFNSDEPQHLHVAWGWTAGLLQYRDVFDNHTPLLHILTAPILAALGERADILYYMRGSMLPLFAVVVIATYIAGRRLYSAQVGLWAAVFLTLFPPFFLKSLEYRNDNLWNAAWMVTLLVVVARPLTVPRSFAAGLCLGISLSASFKTTFLAGALVAAVALTRYVTADRRPWLAQAIAASAGFAVVPLLIVLFFARHGALANLYYCMFEFNRALYDIHPRTWPTRLLFIPSALALFLAARQYRAAHPQRLFLALTAGWVVAIVLSFWLLIGPRDFLPIMPIGAIFLAARLCRMRSHLLAGAATAAVLFVATLYYADWLENRADEHITMMNQVLRVTRPGETLMDLKGETIYRARPFYYAFETVTRAQMQLGRIKDTVREDMIAARCFVSQAQGSLFPPRALQFITDYYVDVGRLRVAGQWIAVDGSFNVAVPGPYVVINEYGQARGTLDGTFYRGARELGAGRHIFERATINDRVAVVWSKSFERGLSPFHLQDRNF